MDKENKTPGNCLYNGRVECWCSANCDQCGWNPDVEAYRKAALREAYAESCGARLGWKV